MNALTTLVGLVFTYVIIFCLLWFGFLLLVSKAFGKKASADVQKLGWRFIRFVARTTEASLRALWRLVTS